MSPRSGRISTAHRLPRIRTDCACAAQAFGLGQRGDVGRDAVQRRLVERHDVHGADEVVDAQRRREARRAVGGQARGSGRRCSPPRSPARTRRQNTAPAWRTIGSSASGSADISWRCSGAIALATAIASVGPVHQRHVAVRREVGLDHVRAAARRPPGRPPRRGCGRPLPRTT